MRPYDWQTAGDFAPAVTVEKPQLSRDALRWQLRHKGQELCMSCQERAAEDKSNLCRICRAA